MSERGEDKMNPFKGRNIITCEDFSNSEIEKILRVASDLKKRYRTKDGTDWLLYKTLFMIHFEQSSKTRNAFEAAITQLGGHAHDLHAIKMKSSHGEAPRDSAKILSRLAEGIACQNFFYNSGHKYLEELAENADVPVFSLQSDVYHPIQALSDLLTLREHFGDNLNGLKVTVSWAYAKSLLPFTSIYRLMGFSTHLIDQTEGAIFFAKPLSVQQSQILLFTRFGIDVTVAAPKEFPFQETIVEKAKQNAEQGGGSLRFIYDMDEGVRNADVVIPKNWGAFAHLEAFKDEEEHQEVLRYELNKYPNWNFDRKRYELTSNAKILHALPAEVGYEIEEELLYGENSLVLDEVENGLHISKSVMALMMSDMDFE